MNYRMKKGQTMIITALFFVALSLATVLSISAPITRQAASARELSFSNEAYSLGEALLEDVVYRYKKGLPVSSVESVSLSGETAYATSTTILGGIEIQSEGVRQNDVRKIKATLLSGTGASFFYGIQSDQGGMDISNSATVVGNVFSNGPLTGSNTNLIKGDAISAGPTGLVNGLHATGTAYAHTIQNSTIDKDAYYVALGNTTVGGVLHPGSIDQATSTLPIADSLIASWEDDAAAGGTVACSSGKYKITSAVTLGPRKIPCDLALSGDADLTLSGALWVVGNIEVSNQAKIRVGAELGGKTVPIIADNPADRLSSSEIKLSNSVTFYGSGAGSYVILLSQNNAAKNSNSNKAIEVSNSVSGAVLVYAGSGFISISNNVSLKEVTGYKIEVKNSAQIIYETGLSNLIFSTGPAGGYTIDSWKEI